METFLLKNGREFLKEVMDESKELDPGELIIFQKKISFTAFSRIVEKNPVADPSRWQHPVKGYVGGRSRGNWLLNVGISDRDYVRDVSGPHTGEAAITEALAKLEAMDAYSVVYITNNVIYVLYLEDGWSKQAPSGMVAVTVEELRAMFP